MYVKTQIKKKKPQAAIIKRIHYVMGEDKIDLQTIWLRDRYKWLNIHSNILSQI